MHCFYFSREHYGGGLSHADLHKCVFFGSYIWIIEVRICQSVVGNIEMISMPFLCSYENQV